MPGHGGPRNQAVRLAREMYIVDPEGMSLIALSKQLKGKPGCTYANLQVWSRKENWPEMRESYMETITELTRIKSQPEVAKVLEQIIKIRLALIKQAGVSIIGLAKDKELMSYGTASTVLMNQGREVLDYFESVGVGAGASTAPEQVLTPERQKQILSIPNPLDEAEKKDENGDKKDISD